jgi:hypothetical protein
MVYIGTPPFIQRASQALLSEPFFHKVLPVCTHKSVFMKIGHNRIIEITAGYDGFDIRIDFQEFLNG